MSLLQLALDEHLRRIARHIQEEWGLWVGVVSKNEAIPFPGRTSVSLPICERLLGNPESALKCQESVRGFYQAKELDFCHHQLGAMVVPIKTTHGKKVGSIYVSGFIPQEEGAPIWDALRKSWPDELIESVPVLTRRQRDSILALMTLMQSVATEALGATEIEEIPSYREIIGASEPMQKLFKELRKVARTQSTVLVRGENGTGKELIAKAIHRDSPRSTMPFLAQNVAAIPADLMESELFGHKKGAYSGAHRDRTGLFEAAHKGTFFLDEIGEMDVSLQVKLLRVLQEGSFLPIGDSEFRKVDVRVICATNRDLEAAVKEGRFRQDLYYRVNVITLTAPPLRYRRDDIPALATHFTQLASHKHDLPPKFLTEDAIARLQEHSWPGNVRELENEIERLVILSGDATEIDASFIKLRAQTRQSAVDVMATDVQLPDAVEELERKMILEVLRRTNWNKSQTARELGVSRRNLIRKVQAFGLEDER
ncbi:AAA family ATPase [Microvenator marinus]|uniref:AAA family ATPase n=1 Tax=Microvenator marinus TaxID=2600177 RepID=A0A5B8XJU2_9DELT|nr:sigma 54-interacting transcriptional regulator [Microvenator marinus]QED26062.1 AAA family ATPase [Microvenator marinus]